MRTAPSHLMMSDEQLLEQFFGSDQVEKLNQFKKSLDDDKVKKQEEENEYEAYLRKNAGKKLEIPVNPYRKSPRYSCDVASEMEQLRARLHETAFKELEEFDKKFSPKLTRPGINPASGESSHSRQGSLDSSFPGQVAQTSSPLLAPSHRREFSLPVYMDPSTTGSPQSASGNSSPFASRSATQLPSKQVGERTAVGGENDLRSPTPPLQYGHIRQLSAGSNSSSSGTFSPPPANVVTSPNNFGGVGVSGGGGGGGLSYNMPRYGGSGGALNRYNYDQASKLSSGGNSPSTRSPSSQSPHFNSLSKQQQQQQSQGQSHLAATRVRSGGERSRDGQHGLVSLGTNLSLPRNTGSTSGGGGGGGNINSSMGGRGSGSGSGLVSIGTNLSLARNSGGVKAGAGIVTNQSPTTTTNTNPYSASLSRMRNAVPSQQVLPNPATSNGVIMRRTSAEGSSSSQTHYSTSVIKKRKSNPTPPPPAVDGGSGGGGKRSSIELQTDSDNLHHHHHHNSGSLTRNGYPISGGSQQGSTLSSQELSGDNVGVFSGSSVGIVHVEQKGVSKGAQQHRLMAPYERISKSPKMMRKPIKMNSTSSATTSNSQNLLMTQRSEPSVSPKRSEPNLLDRGDPSVYPETIQPYMTSSNAKEQLKYYKYTPYASDKSGGQNGTNRNSQEGPESTWC